MPFGNTTKATKQRFCHCRSRFDCYRPRFRLQTAVGIKFSELSLLDARVVAGMLLGALMPALFVAMTVSAVSRTTFAIINEVRRQFHEIKGLMEGQRSLTMPVRHYLHNSALRNLIAPTILAIVVTYVVGVIFGKLASGWFPYWLHRYRLHFGYHSG